MLSNIGYGGALALLRRNFLTILYFPLSTIDNTVERAFGSIICNFIEDIGPRNQVKHCNGFQVIYFSESYERVTADKLVVVKRIIAL